MIKKIHPLFIYYCNIIKPPCVSATLCDTFSYYAYTSDLLRVEKWDAVLYIYVRSSRTSMHACKQLLAEAERWLRGVVNYSADVGRAESLYWAAAATGRGHAAASVGA